MKRMSHRLLKFSDFHSPVVYWSLSLLCATVYIVSQAISVAPNPNYRRDNIIISLATTGGAGVFCLMALSLTRKRRRQARSLGGKCVHCGYDLTGNVSGTCPECGTEWQRKTADERKPH